MNVTDPPASDAVRTVWPLTTLAAHFWASNAFRAPTRVPPSVSCSFSARTSIRTLSRGRTVTSKSGTLGFNRGPAEKRVELVAEYPCCEYGSEMTKEELEACWRDPRNHRWGFYCCKADPRVIVPRRFRWMGWTVNAAHPGTIPTTLFLLGVLAAPIFFVSHRGEGTGVVLLTGMASIAVVSALCAYLSSRTG